MAGAVALLASAVAGCGGRQTQDQTGDKGGGRLSIATGNSTGVYYQLGGAFAKQIDKNLEGYKATVIETSASVDNIKGIVAGKYAIGFSLLDTASDAVRGRESFVEPQPIEALLRLYPNYTQVIVRADSGIDSLADMKGKTVSTGSPNSGTEVIARRLLRSAGLDPAKDVKAQRLALPQTADGMKDGKIDALFWSGGLPTPQITDITTTMGKGVRFLDVSSALPKLQKTYGSVYTEGAIPAATYGQPSATPTIVVPNVLLVKKGYDEELSGRLVKLLFDKRDDLAKINAAAKGITLDLALKSDPVPLNKGAEEQLKKLGAK